MFICIYLYIYIYIHTHTYIHIYIYTHIYIYIYIYLYIYIYIYACINTCTHPHETRTHTYLCTYMHAYMCAYTCACTTTCKRLGYKTEDMCIHANKQMHANSQFTLVCTRMRARVLLTETSHPQAFICAHVGIHELHVPLSALQTPTRQCTCILSFLTCASGSGPKGLRGAVEKTLGSSPSSFASPVAKSRSSAPTSKEPLCDVCSPFSCPTVEARDKLVLSRADA